jgi:hypothetical protein
MTLEVDAVITASETVKGPAIPLDLAELGAVKGFEILGKNLKLRKKVELEILWEGAHFRGADGIEDDLEHGGEFLRKK